MKVIFYINPASRTCRVVRERLNNHNIKYVYKNINSINLTKEELYFLLDRADNGFDDILAKRSIPYRRKKDVIEDMTFNEVIEYIIANPLILRTPILYGKEKTMFGYDKLEFELFMQRLTKGNI